MEEQEIFELNKEIRSYDGSNSFIVSLQKNLKGKLSKYYEYNGRKLKRLSDKQYDAAKSILNS
tara:strand:- start:3671 stop:3859 length:189 start_codon:yes stop_codon:yes gene_type:complete